MEMFNKLIKSNKKNKKTKQSEKIIHELQKASNLQENLWTTSFYVEVKSEKDGKRLLDYILNHEIFGMPTDVFNFDVSSKPPKMCLIDWLLVQMGFDKEKYCDFRTSFEKLDRAVHEYRKSFSKDYMGKRRLLILVDGFDSLSGFEKQELHAFLTFIGYVNTRAVWSIVVTQDNQLSSRFISYNM